MQFFLKYIPPKCDKYKPDKSQTSLFVLVIFYLFSPPIDNTSLSFVTSSPLWNSWDVAEVLVTKLKKALQEHKAQSAFHLNISQLLVLSLRNLS